MTFTITGGSAPILQRRHDLFLSRQLRRLLGLQ